MAEQGIIDNIISQKAIDQLNQLTISLTKVEDLITSINTQNSGKSSGKTNTKQYDELATALNKIVKLETDIANIQAKQTTEIGKATQKINEYTVSKQALNKQNKLEATSINENVGAYSRLSAQYEIAKKTVLDLASAGITSGQAFESAKNAATGYEKELEKVHMVAAQYGKVTRQMYGSTYSLTQVMREMPNFMIDARIGFMSLSNNLPMLKDDFDKLRASGMSTKDALMTFSKSLFSANTAIIIGITLMVAYGDKLIEVIAGKATIAKQAQDNFNKSMQESNNVYSNAFNDLTKVKGAFETYHSGIITQSEALKIYNDTIGKSFGYTNDFAIAEQNVVNKSDAYLEAMKEMAYANIYLSLATKEASSLLSIQSDKSVSMWSKFKGAASEAFDNLKSGKISMDKFVVSFITGYGQISQQQKNINNINKRITDSLKGYIDHYKNSLELSKKGGLNPFGDNKKADELNNKINNQSEALKNWQYELLKANDIINGIDIDIESVFGKQDKQTIYQSHKEALSGAIQALKDSNKEYIDELQRQFQAEEEIYKEKEQFKNDILRSSINTTMDLIDGLTDYYLNKLDEQSEANNNAEDEKLKKLEESHDSGLISDEDYEARKSSIQDFYNKKQDDIDKKEEEAKRKQFLLDQAAALAQVWINYFIAVSSLENLLAAGAFTPLYATLAGISTAGILAQTIPSFEKGGEMDHDGIARVSEKHSEIGLTPSGELFMTPEDESFMFLKKGTQIFPDASSFNNSSISKMVMVNTGMNFSTEKIEKKLDLLTNEVKKLKQRPQKRESLMEKIKFARNYKLS